MEDPFHKSNIVPGGLLRASYKIILSATVRDIVILVSLVSLSLVSLVSPSLTFGMCGA